MKYAFLLLLSALMAGKATAQQAAPLASTVSNYQSIIYANYGKALPAASVNKLAASMLILDSAGMLEIAHGSTLTPRTRRYVNKMADNDFVNGKAVSYQTLLYMTKRNMIKLDEYANPTPATCRFINNTIDYRRCLADAQLLYKKHEHPFRKIKCITPQDMMPPTRGVVDTLIAGVRYFRVLAWKGSADRFQQIDSSNGLRYYSSLWQFPLFVTVDPQLRNWYGQNKDGINSVNDFSARLAQLLGMPPTANNGYMIGLWVRYEDLFRPTFDSSIAHVDYLQDLTPATRNPAYLQWLQTYFNGSYTQDTLFGNYPFTGLGYTYDCNADNFSHIGLAEFITKANTRQYISFIYTTKQFYDMLGEEE